jgi:hypothetical protein
VTGNKFWNVAHTKNFENRQPPLFRFAMANDEAKEDSQTLAGDLRVTVPLVST